MPLGYLLACEQALLFGRVKRVSQERASERQSREERSRVLARLASLAQIGELARRLGIYLCPCGLHFRMVSIFYNHVFPLSL